MNQLEAEQAVHRANEAQRILNEPLLVEALNAQRADIYDKLERTKWDQADAREALYQQLVAINNFEAQFRFHVNNGRMALTWLERWRAQQQLRKARRR